MQWRRLKKDVVMKDFIKALDELPLLVKIILALPVIDIVWVIYRIIKSVASENTLGIVLGVLLLIIGIPFLWLIDIITLIVYNKVLWLE